MRIALVEDDSSQSELVKLWLEKAGYQCFCFYDGKSFMRDIIHETYDLVMLDWQLPDINGDEIVKWMRTELSSYTPVIFVTARDTEEDIVHGLSCGADDYMTKPIRGGEMVARINAIVRRHSSAIDDKQIFEVEEFSFDPVNKILKKNDQEIELTHKEFDLSYFLFRNPGRILSRGNILENIWGKSSDLKTRTVDTHVSRIRSKLDLSKDKGWKLSSIYQHGYRLEHIE